MAGVAAAVSRARCTRARSPTPAQPLLASLLDAQKNKLRCVLYTWATCLSGSMAYEVSMMGGSAATAHARAPPRPPSSQLTSCILRPLALSVEPPQPHLPQDHTLPRLRTGECRCCRCCRSCCQTLTVRLQLTALLLAPRPTRLLLLQGITLAALGAVAGIELYAASQGQAPIKDKEGY